MSRNDNKTKPETASPNDPTIPTIEEIMAQDPAVLQAQILQMNLMTAKLNFEAAQRAAQAAPTQAVLSEDAELKSIQLQTARLDMLLAQERNASIIETREERIARRKAALEAMEAEARTWKNIQAQCAHAVGGFDLADTFNGDGKSSIICSTLPVIGMELFYCTRCRKESITPDKNMLNPAHKVYDPERYKEEMAEYVVMKNLFRNSYNSKAMGGPQFQFTRDADGLPVHPTIV
jgi:hypothetical protein